MISLKIAPYTAADNEAALALERECTQGQSLALRFCRPTFHTRSEVYDRYRIFCAKADEKLVGVAAWAEKFVKLHGAIVRAAYVYDVRVHPSYRKGGTAKRLTDAVLEDAGPNVDCIYTLIAGENERALGLARRGFGAQSVMPLTYVVMPVYRPLRGEKDYCRTSARVVHEMYLRLNSEIEFQPILEPSKLLGHVTSISLRRISEAGCSIWTNENLLAEQVVHLPLRFQLMRLMAAPLRPFLSLPRIPKRMEVIRSWFLFDLCAQDEESLYQLLAVVNDLALEDERSFIYMLFTNSDPLLPLIRNAGLRCFSVPYFLLAKGRVLPCEKDRIYIDVRDL